MRALIVLTACLALVAGGCGNSEAEDTNRRISDRLGGQGEQDAQVVGEFTQALSPLAEIDIEIVKAFASEDAAAAQKGIDRLEKVATEAKAAGEKAESAKLREFLTEYADGAGGVGDAYQRVIDRPNATEDEIVEDITSAKTELLRLDTQYNKALRAALPPDEREELDAHVRKMEKQLEEAASGGG
jgi:hypothetical protein